VKSKKEVYYVQTDEEMKAQLLQRGLGDSQLDLGDGQVIAGDRMAKLATILASMEEAVLALERRGISLREHANRQDKEGRLPMFHVLHGREERWFTTRAELDAYVAEKEQAAGGELSVNVKDEGEANPTGKEATNGNGKAGGDGKAAPGGRVSELQITELHEVRTINSGLGQLKSDFGFDLEMLIPKERTGSDQPRYVLRRGEHESALRDLRGLVPAVREIGQRGLQVTRFKGLGEMNAEELRETTLDPEHRTLLKVSMNDAGAADDMFRVLMGEKVEPRREFIEKHALEVRNLDV